MPKILIVDEDSSLREILSSGLINADYQVQAIGSTEQALELMNQERFDLVITEIKFDHKFNYDFISQIKDEKFHRPNSDQGVAVIVLTAFADLRNAVECKKHGAEDFVSKPYDLFDLLTTIERVLSD